ncbi:hypothetical protein O181_069954 [Austropuccinia psidii MF-1]|uniref:Uncharacterized protein n=1 Tax=Austropuccinia psidii MF-1 TaxID=1389203 RepID=A0A9Q3F0A4_9BASI|nr:hypothetical protein [Austropuccinia psidii MF-1]
MDITLDLDTRYLERKKKKSHHQEKKPEASKSNSSNPQNSSYNQNKKKNFQKRDNPHSSLLNEYFKLMNSEKKEQSSRAYVPIVVGSIVSSLVSKRLQNQLAQLSCKLPS